MATNYFIAIGGSGSKVLESLTHLCAMGIMPGSENDEISSLVIDPDDGNGNLNRAKGVYDAYQRLQQVDFGTDTNLIKTKISSDQLPNYFVNPVDNYSKYLDKAMDVDKYHPNDPLRQLYEMLYTEEERLEDLHVGFRGHPAIGAAIIARNLQSSLGSNPAWAEFISKLRSQAKQGGVKIFLVGSIFGGTGAAGVPNIAKRLKDELEDVWDHVTLGGGLVLPYFYCMPTNEERAESGMCVTSNEFMANTQAALNYYYLKMQTEQMYHSLYLVGYEDCSKPIGNFSVGADKQKNDAHVVDLYTAMAAMDFYGRDAKVVREHPRCYYTSYSGTHITWNDLPSPSNNKADDQRKIEQFIRFALSYQHFIRFNLKGLKEGSLKAYAFAWYKNFSNSSSNDFNLSDDGYVNFNRYIDYFLEWARQLSKGNGSLIDQSVFIGKESDISVNVDAFSTCIGGEVGYDLNTIHNRICKDRFNRVQNGGTGFGKLMRVLYESCAKY